MVCTTLLLFPFNWLYCRTGIDTVRHLVVRLKVDHIREPPLQYSHFWTGGTVPPLFRKKRWKKLLSSAVNRGDLWRLNYNKNHFRRGLSALLDALIRLGKDTSSRFSFLRVSWLKGASFSFWIGTPKLRRDQWHCCQCWLYHWTLCLFVCTPWAIKKRATLFLIITLAFLGWFLYFLHQWKEEG